MDIIGRTAVELAEAVGAGRLHPVEVVTAHLDRIERLDPLYGAFAALRRGAALAEAETLADRPDLAALPLAGVPVAIKDNLDVEGEPTHHGLSRHDPAPASRDDPVVAALRRAGAVVVGKTTLPEMAPWPFTDAPERVTRNPWDTTRTCGGSSGGSATAVAAAMVPLAVGNDGLGSIRIPSAATGIFGLKPGSGLVPIHGLDGSNRVWFGMSQHGPMATSVADAALMLDVMAGTDRHRALRPPDEPLRVAVSVASPSPTVRTHPTHVEAVLEAGRLLRHAGHHVVRADPPYRTTDVLPLLARWTQAVAEELELLGVDDAALQPRTRRHAAIGRWFRRTRPVDPADADRVRQRMDAFLEDHDVVLAPVVAGPPPAATGWYGGSWWRNFAAALAWAPFPGIWNLADVPAGSVPVRPVGGHPVGVQLVAPRRREDRVFQAARAIEALAPWERTAPIG